MEPLCWYWYFGFGHIFFPKLNRLGYNNLWYIPAHCIEKNLGKEKQKLFAVFMPFLDATQHLFCLRKVNDRHEKCGIFSISCNIFPIEKLYDAEHRTFKTYVVCLNNVQCANDILICDWKQAFFSYITNWNCFTWGQQHTTQVRYGEELTSQTKTTFLLNVTGWKEVEDKWIPLWSKKKTRIFGRHDTCKCNTQC